MTKRSQFPIVIILFLVTAFIGKSCKPAEENEIYKLPKGWSIAGSNPENFHIGIDKKADKIGKKTATILSKNSGEGFGTLMQMSQPDKYLGKRVRMSGNMRSENVEGWSGLWLRIDKAGSDMALAFDNMQNRAVTGTTDWKKYEIVLDVPDSASNMAYGALLRGKGQIWFDNINFEIVDKSVPTTNLYGNSQPQNLNFDE